MSDVERAARGEARVGCSGWSYRDWRGRAYPADVPSTRWFPCYAAMFDTVELNNTFYRLPTVRAAEQWGAQAPPDFVYALKLGQFGTHRMKLLDATRWLPNHLDRAERLGASRGPTLVQLPPRWRRNVERLDEFLSVAPRTMRWAVELRDPSWVHDDVFDVLRKHGAALCLHDLLDAHPRVLTTDWTYVRFHGPHAQASPYHGRYGPGLLQPWADWLEEQLADGIDAYCYFNNDVGAAAVEDARWLRDALATRAAAA